MAVHLTDPEFPIIDKEPSFSKIVGSFRREDYVNLAGATLLGAPLGYYMGYKAYVQRPSMYMGMFMLGGTVFTALIQQSAARLMGYAPNEPEQELHFGKKGL